MAPAPQRCDQFLSEFACQNVRKILGAISRFIAFYIGKCLFVFVCGWFEISKNWRTLCHCRRKWTCPQSVLSKSGRRHGRYDYDPSSGIKATKCWSTAVAGSTPPSKAWISPWFLKNHEEVERFAPDTSPMQLFLVLCCVAYGCLWPMAFFLRLLCFQWRPVELESSKWTATPKSWKEP